MAFSIGRAGKTLLLNDPSMWAEQNGQITVTIISTLSPTTNAQILRDQLLGYIDNWDEPIVPVIVDSEPRLTGYYEVTGVQCDTDLVAIAKGTFTAYVSLKRVMGFTQPMIESILSGALLTNAVGAVGADATGFHAAPSTLSEYTGFTLLGVGSRLTADSATPILFGNEANVYSKTSRFATAPTNFYVGAATFEQGSALQPLVGRTLTQVDTNNWRISNGLVRITPNLTTGVANGKIDVSHYDGSVWETVKTYALISNAGGTPTGFTSLTVLRNSVEEVTVRLGLYYGGGPLLTLDLSLRRGDRIARLYLDWSVNGSIGTWKLQRDTVEAATAIVLGAVASGLIRATANDASGNRYCLFSVQTITINDLVNGSVRTPNSVTADFGIGSEIGGSGAAAYDRAVDLASQYLAGQSESQRVVAR